MSGKDDFCWQTYNYWMIDPNSRHSTAARQIAHLIAFPLGYFAFQHENVKLKVKYGFVLHWFCRIPTSTLGLSPPTWKWVECPTNLLVKDQIFYILVISIWWWLLYKGEGGATVILQYYNTVVLICQHTQQINYQWFLLLKKINL